MPRTTVCWLSPTWLHRTPPVGRAVQMDGATRSVHYRASRRSRVTAGRYGDPQELSVSVYGDPRDRRIIATAPVGRVAVTHDARFAANGVA